jgi:hypothetical protein
VPAFALHTATQEQIKPTGVGNDKTNLRAVFFFHERIGRN